MSLPSGWLPSHSGEQEGGFSPSLISATNLHLFSLIPIVVRLKTKRKIAKAKKNIYKGSLLAMSKAFFDCTKPLVQRKSITHLIALNLLLSESLSLI